MFTNVPHSPTHARVPLFEFRDMSLKRGSIKSVQTQIGADLPPRPSIRQAAEFHGVDQKTIRRWICSQRQGSCVGLADTACSPNPQRRSSISATLHTNTPADDLARQRVAVDVETDDLVGRHPHKSARVR